jgi:hypothetical protein
VLLIAAVLNLVVVSVLVWAKEVIVTFVEAMTADVRVGVMTIVSDVAIDLLVDGLTGIMFGVGVDVLVAVIVNVFSGEMTAFEFAMSCPLNEFRSSVSFDCRPMAALD